METDSADKSDSTGFMPYDKSRPFPPSNVPYNELQPILISQMQPQTHHRGKRTVLRVVSNTIRHQNQMVAAVRDEAGTMSGVQLQGQPFEEVVPAEQILRADCWYLIKEPLVVRSEKGENWLRVDHPGDIILLPPYHEFIPLESRNSNFLLAKSGEVRLRGNDAVGKKNWAEAEDLYSLAIRTAETGEEATLAYLNRSLANLRLGRPAIALADAVKSNETAIIAPTEKGLFREASALYDLAKFDQCLDKLQALKTAFPANPWSASMIDRVQERLKEQQIGHYDFRRMYKQAKATPPLIDCATYTMPVEIRDSPGKGRGVFTKKKVLAGELLICEKAFGYIYGGKDRPSGESMEATDMQRSLQTQIVQKLFHSIEDARMFAKLCHGDYNTVPVDEVDGNPVIDIWFVMYVIKFTSYCSPRTTLSEVSGDTTGLDFTSTMAGFGLWSFISHINHSCLSNAMRSFIGDVMIVRAERDLEAGEEILVSYEVPMPFESYTETQERLSNWDFTCDCALCVEKKATPNEVILKRKSLDAQLMQCMMATEVQKLLNQLEQTYSDGAASGVRLEVASFCQTLGTMFNIMGKHTEGGIEMLLKGLEAHGFIITAKPRLRVAKWGQGQETIDAFRALHLAYKATGAPQNAQAAKSYLEIAYSMFMGEKETILETYPETA